MSSKVMAEQWALYARAVLPIATDAIQRRQMRRAFFAGAEAMLLRVIGCPSGRGKAQCAPDPAYPSGVDLDVTKSAERFCLVQLPYPVPECGYWMVSCLDCQMTVAVSAAGRRDDPRSVKLPCQSTPREESHA